MRRTERLGGLWVGYEWAKLQSKAESEVSSSSSTQSQLPGPCPGFTHAAPFSSKRVHPRGTNRGLGKRITADHSTSVGKRPTEKFTHAVQALLSPAKPPFCLHAVLCADFSQPCQPSRPARRLSWLSSAAPFVCCTPRHPRGRGRTSGYFISIAVHYYGPVSAGPPRTTQTVTQSGCQSLLSSSSRMPEHLGPFAPRGARLSLPTLFRSPGPGRADVHGLNARAGGETELARRAISGPTSFCLYSPRRSPHNTREEDRSREGCQVERGPG